MRRSGSRVRIAGDGGVEIVDPGFADLPLLAAVDPAFEIQAETLPGFGRPRLLATRRRGAGLTRSELTSFTDEELKRRHAERCRQGPSHDNSVHAGADVSLLDLKIELAERALRSCRLCARDCRVDRIEGPLGVCGLGPGAMVAEAFTHIAEEAPINPSFVISLAGCGLRCRFCQQHELLFPRKLVAAALGPTLWQEVDRGRARSLSFVGGNPDENLPAILRFLRAAPDDWDLPIVWNTHAYVPADTLDLLDGIVDVYLPDYKYGSAACGRRLSHVDAYPEVAERAIRTMLRQDAPVIVRILVLPGHGECCHVPALASLARLNTGDLRVSIRGQYCPDWGITTKDGALARRPHVTETAAVRAAADKLGLKTIEPKSRAPPD